MRSTKAKTICVNAFGAKIPEISSIFKDKQIEQCINSMLTTVLDNFGLDKGKAAELALNCIELAKSINDFRTYENAANELLEDYTSTTSKVLSLRTKKIYSQIRPYLIEGSVLDFGCGDGKVGELLSKSGFDVTLSDVYQNINMNGSKLPFSLFRQGDQLQFPSDTFDNTLALTVYHHSNDPILSISETARVTKNNGGIIVIESVFGVTGKELSLAEQTKIKKYLSLSIEQQRLVNIFFDHFYNRVVHYSNNQTTKVNVPFNFNTPEQWEKIFAKCDLVQDKIVHLGVDQPAVPEYHTLHVLRVLK
jgi:SAM-dependent methyltransferase